MSTVNGVIVLLVLSVVAPFVAGWAAPTVRIAQTTVIALILVVSFAPLGADQPAPWQAGFPADGDWRVVFFPVWVVIGVMATYAGWRVRHSMAR
jgi:hypothetical protein